MSRAKHTDGPWERTPYGQIVGRDRREVCFRGVTTLCSGSSEAIAEAEANTDLISAAPDLLASLEGLLAFAEQLEKRSIKGTGSRRGGHIFAKARAMIASATGANHER